jgi:hypothetical protein
MMVTSLRSFDQHANTFKYAQAIPGEPVHFPNLNNSIDPHAIPTAYHTIPLYPLPESPINQPVHLSMLPHLLKRP